MRTKCLLLIYVAGMALTFDSLIWGRESLHSAFGGMITWVAVMIWFTIEVNIQSENENFCFILRYCGNGNHLLFSRFISKGARDFACPFGSVSMAYRNFVSMA